MARNSLPRQDAADHKEQNGGIAVELRRCAALLLIHQKPLTTKDTKGHKGFAS
jgi:hypothetical protein